MDPIKEAFQKIKQDIDTLKEDIGLIRQGLLEVSDRLDLLSNPTHNPIQSDKPTDKPTHNPFNLPYYTLKEQNSSSSIGNRGVPTDKPTNQQTNQHIEKHVFQTQLNDPISEFKRANEVLSSLDSIKKEIRAKFKALTLQEMAIFAQIWALDEESQAITYKAIAEKTHLSESSIRDYTNKLIKKGVPIDKIKQNNKIIILKLSPDLKNLTTLDTILHLRNL